MAGVVLGKSVSTDGVASEVSPNNIEVVSAAGGITAAVSVPPIDILPECEAARIPPIQQLAISTKMVRNRKGWLLMYLFMSPTYIVSSYIYD